MSESSSASPGGRPGLIAGPLLFVFGAVAAVMAAGFDDESRTFPLALGVLLALSGVGILLQALLGERKAGFRVTGQAHVAVAVALLGAWGLAFAGGLGFIVPTFALQAGLLMLGGVRRPVPLIAIAATVTLVAWLLFVVLLDIPLPISLLPDAWQRF